MSGARGAPRSREILLAHGGGGRRTQELLAEVFLPRLGNETLSPLADAALLRVGKERIAFTTDSFVVSPIVFPGGDLGSLAVCGTVNDLSVMGARPIALSAGFVLEEGLSVDLLGRLVDSMARVCGELGVPVVAGDTKVVERGAVDQAFINTAGVGLLDGPLPEGPAAVRPGDRVLVSGPIGDHGTAVLAARGDLSIEAPIESDCAALWPMVRLLLERTGGVRWMRDPTRGGLAMIFNELLRGRPLSIEIDEDRIPVRPSVRALCGILGIDPLYVACEGRVALLVAPEAAEPALAALRAHPLGAEAAEVGRVTGEGSGRLVLRTSAGGRRILDPPSGEQLPRIC